MWIWTAIATLSGLTGTYFGVRGYLYARDASVRQRQEKLCAELKQLLRSQNRLVHSVNRLDKTTPPSLLDDDLRGLRSFIRREKHVFRAPTQQHLEVVEESIGGALTALDAARRTPINDTALSDDVQEIKRNLLRGPLQTLLDQINVLLQGLTEMERKTMSVRKQKKLFKKLDSPNEIER